MDRQTLRKASPLAASAVPASVGEMGRLAAKPVGALLMGTATVTPATPQVAPHISIESYRRGSRESRPRNYGELCAPDLSCHHGHRSCFLVRPPLLPASCVFLFATTRRGERWLWAGGSERVPLPPAHDTASRWRKGPLGRSRIIASSFPSLPAPASPRAVGDGRPCDELRRDHCLRKEWNGNHFWNINQIGFQLSDLKEIN